MEPTYSPWGEVQACSTLYYGIHLVTAPGHGGIMVERESIPYLTGAARKCGFMDGSYLCFEEDCQEQIVLRELLDRGLWAIPGYIKDPDAFEAAIDENIQRYHPEYWQARQRRMYGATTPKKQCRTLELSR